MIFYITPDKREECANKLDKMFKHFAKKPAVEFSEVHEVVKTTKIAFEGEEGEGAERWNVDTHRYRINVIKVTIEDIEVGEWKLVASVYYRENVVTLVNKELFKDVPQQFGLDYMRCDYCGGTRSKRIESHILYNTVKGQWMQVGSECLNKVVDGGKYLASIITKLYEFFEVRLGGCDEEGYHGWRVPSHNAQRAITFDTAVMACKSFRENVTAEWVKGRYDNSVYLPGTNKDLQNYYIENEWTVDDSLLAKVRAYVDTLKGGVDFDGEPDFNQRIKDAVRDEWIAVQDIYLAYFALKGYEDSLTAGDFDAVLQSAGIEKGVKYTFKGSLSKLEEVECVDYYGQPYMELQASFIEAGTGLVFVKSVSYGSVIDPYKQEDGSYKFKATVKYIARKKRYIGLGGRLSKA